MKKWNLAMRPTVPFSPSSEIPQIRADSGWPVWIRLAILYSSGTFPITAAMLAQQDANNFGILTLYTSRWYSMNIHAFRIYFPPGNAVPTEGEIQVYDFSNGADPLIDDIYFDALASVTTVPKPIGRRFGKVISQYNVGYASALPIISIISGRPGTYLCDFQVVFH